MQVGGSGTIKSDINVTPLVDVVLVLLIIFMVITPVVQMGYLVRVPPKAPPGTPISAPDQIILRLMPDNHIFINRDEVTPADFPLRIHDIMHGNQAKMVFFQGSPDVDYDATMKFLDMARASGAKNIGIIVEAAQ
jgi:biopolymer transport protein TolR